MKALEFITPIIKSEKVKKRGSIEVNEDCKNETFRWSCYLKKERRHNLAMAMFTK